MLVKETCPQPTIYISLKEIGLEEKFGVKVSVLLTYTCMQTLRHEWCFKEGNWFLRWIVIDSQWDLLVLSFYFSKWLAQFSSVTQPCPTLCDPMNRSTPGLPVHHQLPEFTQTHVHWVGNAIQPSHPLSSPSPPAFNLSQHHGLLNESALHIRWPKYWSFSFNISLSNQYSGLISFRMDWLDLLAVQGTLKSLLQHHGSKPSILWGSAFFIVQLLHPYTTTGKTLDLTRQTFVSKVLTCCLGWS